MGKDVVIVGGGIIGLCSAYYCTLAGHRVTVVERGPAHHNCCARGNAGMIVPSHFVPLAAPGMAAMGMRMMGNPKSPFYIKPRLDWRLADWGMKFIEAATADRVAAAEPVLRDLHLESRKLFLQLSSQQGFNFGLKRNGLLMLCQTPEMLSEESAMSHRARALGIPAETLDTEETSKLDPGVDLEICGSVYYPEDCHLDPARLLDSLTRFLTESGVRFKWQSEATQWVRTDGRIRSIQLPDGELEGDEFIVAGGSLSPNLVKSLGIHLPMQAGKGFSVTVKRPPQLPKICSILTEARVAVTPMGKSVRFGGTMEMSGINHEISAQRVTGITESAARYFPRFNHYHFESLQPWVGLRPCSPDGLPYLGRSSVANNLIVATGHAMLGLSLGPITGQTVAQFIDGKSPGISSPLLSPDRYNGF